MQSTEIRRRSPRVASDRATGFWQARAAPVGGQLRRRGLADAVVSDGAGWPRCGGRPREDARRPIGGTSTVVYFACEDCAIEESRVEKAGGRIFKKKYSIGQYGFISLVYDTEGTMIGLYSMN